MRLGHRRSRSTTEAMWNMMVVAISKVRRLASRKTAKKVEELPFGSAMSLVTIAAITMIMGSLKMKISRRGCYLSGQMGQGWLVGAGKLLEL